MARTVKTDGSARRRPPHTRGRWLAIKVVLTSGLGFHPDQPPGRRMLVSPDHTLAEFAEAIDVAFARWDHSHLDDLLKKVRARPLGRGGSTLGLATSRPNSAD